MNVKKMFEMLRKPKILLLLFYLNEHKSATIGTLRKEVSNNPNMIIDYVNTLERFGFVKSRRVKTKNILDARVVEITDKGEKFLEDLKEFLKKCEKY